MVYSHISHTLKNRVKCKHATLDCLGSVSNSRRTMRSGRVFTQVRAIKASIVEFILCALLPATGSPTFADSTIGYCHEKPRNAWTQSCNYNLIRRYNFSASAAWYVLDVRGQIKKGFPCKVGYQSNGIRNQSQSSLHAIHPPTVAQRSEGRKNQ